MVLNVHRNHKAYLLGMGRRGYGGGREGKGCLGEIIYLSLHCHHQSDSCIKMGSDVLRCLRCVVVLNNQASVTVLLC